ncbi:hypothetical protein PBY51_014255 [Eleginops maclovinus]|uniref:Chemokine interleukin-8-like domain-containing protein n=1 Tax=Eleginops maclovinus TaxID=56733 RepID=A0AAN7WM24_ELEMC|nr:hypothetical protein PBY51_014255 [Eleginops maclovinus]
MASGKVCFLATLCSLLILSTFIGDAQSARCCLGYTNRRLPCKPLLGYTIQNINRSCDIPTVIFHLRGRFVCADPSSIHTQRLTKCLDARLERNNRITANRT